MRLPDKYPTLSRRGFLLLGGGAASGLLGAGCGGGGGGTPAIAAEDDPASVLPTGPELPTVASAQTRLVPGDGSVTVAAVEENRVVLTGNVAGMGIEPGLIVASLLGDGFVRRVVNLASDGGSGVVLETAPATLTEAFDSLEIRGLDNLTEVGRAEPTIRLDKIVENLELKLPGNLTLAGSGGNTLKLAGSVKFGGQIAAAVRFRKKNPQDSISTPEFMAFKVVYSVTGQITVKGELKVLEDKYQLSSVTRVVLGNVRRVLDRSSTVLKPILDLNVRFSGAFRPGMSVTLGLGLGGSAAFVYTEANGFSYYTPTPKFRTPSFTPTSTINPYDNTTFTAALNPTLKLHVLGIAGPFLDFAAPELTAQFKRTVEGGYGGIRTGLKGKLKGDLGIDDAYKVLSLPRYNLFDQQLFTFDNFYDDVFSGNYNVR